MFKAPGTDCSSPVTSCSPHTARTPLPPTSHLQAWEKRLKRGGNLERVDMEHVELAAPVPDDDLLALDKALTRLSTT